jgi:hypothetical protein
MPSDEQIDAALARRWRRGFLAWGIVAAIVAATIGWSILWFAASRFAQSRMDAWFEQEARRGRTWSCADRRLEGFPSRLSVVCGAASFTGMVEGSKASGRVASLAAGVSLLSPRRVMAGLGSPMTIEALNGSAGLTLAFASLELDLDLQSERFALHGERLEAHWSGPTGAVDGAAQSVEFAAQPAEAQNAYHLELRVTELALPELDAFTGAPEPAALSATALLTGAEPSLAGGWKKRLERWRAAQGRLLLERLTFAKGALEVTAAGDLGLDEQRRPQGRLDIGQRGANAILLRLGAPPAAVGLANALNGLRRGADANRTPVTLPFTFKDGKARLGPLRNLFSLQPLY